MTPFRPHLHVAAHCAISYLLTHLIQFTQWPAAKIEQIEKLEQLRALENGFSIAVARVEHDSVGVDVPTDVARVEALLASTASVTHCA